MQWPIILQTQNKRSKHLHSKDFILGLTLKDFCLRVSDQMEGNQKLGETSLSMSVSSHFHLLCNLSVTYLDTGSISTADGSALVRLGDTTIVCGVKAEIAEPELDKPEDGYLGMPFTVLWLAMD
jgi:hypothetical protein